jgi:hypothetical protein
MKVNPRMSPSTGARTMKAVILSRPDGINAPKPAFATAAPEKPPMRAWDELDGMP